MALLQIPIKKTNLTRHITYAGPMHVKMRRASVCSPGRPSFHLWVVVACVFRYGLLQLFLSYLALYSASAFSSHGTQLMLAVGFHGTSRMDIHTLDTLM